MLPVFIENSKVPKLLSYVSPIEIGAISLGIFVFARGKVSPTQRRHETIHYRQWVELGLVGFLVLYPFFWLWKLAKHRDGAKAYEQIPFEQEAYSNEHVEGYLSTRKLFAWKSYLRS